MRVVMDVVERGSGKRVRERVRRARCHDVVVEERPRVQVAVLHRRAAQRRGRVLSRPPRVREVALLVARGNLHACDAPRRREAGDLYLCDGYPPKGLPQRRLLTA